jgi:hypothetical protein
MYNFQLDKSFCNSCADRNGSDVLTLNVFLINIGDNLNIYIR